MGDYMKKRYVTTFFTALIFSLTLSSTVSAANSIEDIKTKWRELKPKYQGEAYIEKPVLTSPYSAGKLSDGILKDALNMTNFVRYLAGLPNDLELDPVLVDQAQHGAVVLAANDELSHYPSKPAGMDDAFYNLGLKSTSSSNIYSGSTNLWDTVVGYMDDSDTRNIDRVGHRRWVLYPQLKKTGFGLADEYSPMQVFDKSRTEKVDYSYISWPNAGYAPNYFFGYKTAWSVLLNPEIYDNENTDNIKVKLTRTSDGTTWQFDKNDRDTTGKYFNVETTPYGIPYAIIFRPDNITKYRAGDTFNVMITGIVDKSGNPTEISYSTSFFDLQKQIYISIYSNKMIVNGEDIEIDPGRNTRPVVVNDRVLLPVRAVIENLGGKIDWNAEDNSVTVKLNNNEIKMSINDKTIFVNGVKKMSDVEPQIINDRTMIPIRVLAENAGVDVKWEEKAKTVIITGE